jgi:hypothetical protein
VSFGAVSSKDSSSRFWRPGSRFHLEPLARRSLVVAVGCLGLAWGMLVLPQSRTTDELREVESHLLRSETFDRTTFTQMLDGAASQDLSPCDTHAQRAMLLAEMPLAEAALRSGATNDFDRHMLALESRSRQALGCAPRDSFTWLLAFDLDVLHGQLNQQAFNRLAMSYETSPNEAWIAIRRLVVALPLVLVAPEPLRNKMLAEFQRLVRTGMPNDAARTYWAAPAAGRPLLLAQVSQLSPAQQTAFTEALRRSRS